MHPHTTLSFDTLKYAKKLREAGFTEQQAEVQAETQAETIKAVREVIDEKLATKQDLKQSLKELQYQLIIKLGGLVVIGVAVLAALIKL